MQAAWRRTRTSTEHLTRLIIKIICSSSRYSTCSSVARRERRWRRHCDINYGIHWSACAAQAAVPGCGEDRWATWHTSECWSMQWSIAFSSMRTRPVCGLHHHPIRVRCRGQGKNVRPLLNPSTRPDRWALPCASQLRRALNWHYIFERSNIMVTHVPTGIYIILLRQVPTSFKFQNYKFLL